MNDEAPWNSSANLEAKIFDHSLRHRPARGSSYITDLRKWESNIHVGIPPLKKREEYLMIMDEILKEDE